MLTPPLGSISDIFEFENILMTEDPPTNILKELFRHIYIKKGQIKCFNFSFLGWGLKVIYNSDIFEKLRPPRFPIEGETGGDTVLWKSFPPYY